MNVTELLAPWAAVNAALGLGAGVRDEAHYTELLAFVDECFERFGGDDAHPVFGLVGLVADRIRAYEDLMHPWPNTSTPQTVLGSLMQMHGIRQTELPEVGSQGVVSEVLAGKRALNLRQVKALSERFSVPMEMLA